MSKSVKIQAYYIVNIIPLSRVNFHFIQSNISKRPPSQGYMSSQHAGPTQGAKSAISPVDTIFNRHSTFLTFFR